MFNNYIYINSKRDETIPNIIVKYLVIFFALIGSYKVVKWLICIFNFILLKKQQSLFDQKQYRSKNISAIKKRAPAKKKLNPTFKWSTDTEISDEEEHLIPETPRILKPIYKKHSKPKNDFEFFKSEHLKTSTSSDSIMGVATAAATAATVFLDRRRLKCCGKCCGKQNRRELC